MSIDTRTVTLTGDQVEAIQHAIDTVLNLPGPGAELSPATATAINTALETPAAATEDMFVRAETFLESNLSVYLPGWDRDDYTSLAEGAVTSALITATPKRYEMVASPCGSPATPMGLHQQMTPIFTPVPDLARTA